MAKYWLDLREDRMTLYTVGDKEEVYDGHLKDAGITDEYDFFFQDKLDDFFQREFGIAPDEWEIG